MVKKKPYKKIGDKLRELRGDLTQRVFAQKINLSEVGYKRYEYGERLPGLETLLRVSLVCDVSISEILLDYPDKRLAAELIEEVLRDPNKGKSLVDAVETLYGNKLKFPKFKKFLVEDGDYNQAFDGEDIEEIFKKILFIFVHAPDRTKQSFLDIVDTYYTSAILVESGSGKRKSPTMGK